MIALSLFDYSGNMVKPWHEVGYNCICVDTQHHDKLPRCISGPSVYKVNYDISGILRYASNWPRPDIIFGFPPCTDLAVSGARWFRQKAQKDPWFQERAVNLCRQVEALGNMFNCPWMLENPVSRLSTLWRKPDHWFHPWQFADRYPSDNYTKKTGIWCGNGFIMPQGLSKPIRAPDDRIHKATPGPKRANFRSATPRGFADAVFEANNG